VGVTFDEHVGDVHPGSQWCSCSDRYPLTGEPLDDRCPACRACIVPVENDDDVVQSEDLAGLLRRHHPGSRNGVRLDAHRAGCQQVLEPFDDLDRRPLRDADEPGEAAADEMVRSCAAKAEEQRVGVRCGSMTG
jgi:hypothetical protein